MTTRCHGEEFALYAKSPRPRPIALFRLGNLNRRISVSDRQITRRQQISTGMSACGKLSEDLSAQRTGHHSQFPDQSPFALDRHIWLSRRLDSSGWGRTALNDAQRDSEQ
jgi:hypothetical protein